MTGYHRKKHAVVSPSGESSTIIALEGVKVPSGDAKLTVGEVAKLTGIPATTLRHYDKIGLLCPARSGENVANNRKLYDADDLERLQAIVTLSAYQFDLDEIRQVLDEGADLHELMSAKLAQLKRQETRLRNLIQFAKFVENADTELIEGLACGPFELDELANLARTTPLYSAAIEKLERLSVEEPAAMFAELDAIIGRFISLEESDGFAGLEAVIERFFTWWSANVAPIDEIGFLGFWAIFEDHGLIAERVEEVGDAGDAGFLQMDAFYVSMKRMTDQAGPLIAEISQLANEDVVVALEKTGALVGVIAGEMLGTQAPTSFEHEALTDLAFAITTYLCDILQDEELRAYLELEGDLAFGLDDALNTLRALELFEVSDAGDAAH